MLCRTRRLVEIGLKEKKCGPDSPNSDPLKPPHDAIELIIVSAQGIGVRQHAADIAETRSRG
jgi:hypothetical protein